jgi:hypothetical protein
MDLDYYGGIFLGKSNTAAISFVEQFICTKRKRIISLLSRPLYYICSWFLSFYDPTIGFGLEVMTSNLIDLAITIN